MELVTILGAVVLSPLLCLGFLMWMAHLEDTLFDAVGTSEPVADATPSRLLIDPGEPLPLVGPRLPAQRVAPVEEIVVRDTAVPGVP